MPANKMLAVSGGDPIQISERPGQKIQPAGPPDGKYIAYRSEQGDGGIYVIPALGGEELERATQLLCRLS